MAEPPELAEQYADRPHLRPVLEALLAAATRMGDVRVVVRQRQVSLVGPVRTFAMVQATLRRVDVALRLSSARAGGRLVANRGEQYAVRLELRSPNDVDGEAIAWLRRAYEENAAPRPRRKPGPRHRVVARRAVRLVIEGVDLPGRRCNPDASGHVNTNVHAGMRCNDLGAAGVTALADRPWGVVGLVAGDAPQARWETEVLVSRLEHGYDFRGRCVQGGPGQRSVGLAWGEVGGDGSFIMFRGLGLKLEQIPRDLVEEAFADGARLVGRLALTDAKGNPRCASVPARDVAWSVMT